MQLHLNQVFLQEIQEIALVDFNNFLTMEISDLLDCDNAATMETYALHFGASGKDVVFLDHGGAHLGSSFNQ